MKNQGFEGVAVHPGKVDANRGIVGVWLRRYASAEQRWRLRMLESTLAKGHILVHEGALGTAIKYVGPLDGEVGARKQAAWLARSVDEIFGVTTILRQLADYREVSRALVV